MKKVVISFIIIVGVITSCYCQENANSYDVVFSHLKNNILEKKSSTFLKERETISFNPKQDSIFFTKETSDWFVDFINSFYLQDEVFDWVGNDSTVYNMLKHRNEIPSKKLLKLFEGYRKDWREYTEKSKYNNLYISFSNIVGNHSDKYCFILIAKRYNLYFFKLRIDNNKVIKAGLFELVE